MSTDRALILDFGGVVTRTLFETHALTEQALGLSPDSLTWRGPFAPETDPLWVRMQNDDISERDYWLRRTREVGRMTGQDWTQISQFVRAARGADPDAVIRPQAIRAIDAAKSLGASLAILSNELDLFYGAEIRHELPLLGKFDVIIDATYTGILKPDPQAYLECAKALAVEPGNCVFVDDQKRNVRGADEVGMRALQFDVRRPDESYKRALQRLVDLPEELEHA